MGLVRRELLVLLERMVLRGVLAAQGLSLWMSFTTNAYRGFWGATQRE